MVRIAGYVVGLAALAFLILNARLHFLFDAKGPIIALLIALVAIPIGCVLDFLGRSKRVLPRVPLWLLRVTALVVWVFTALISSAGMLLYLNSLPEPLARQGPDTENARGALIQRFGAGFDAVFRNAYYFCTPTFTGSPTRFLSFDYPDKTDLLRRLGGTKILLPASPSDCQCCGSLQVGGLA
jgi:hypothetical protein